MATTLRQFKKLGFVQHDALVPLELNVTADDWVTGQCKSPAHCAIANSIRRAFPDSTTWVGAEIVYIARREQKGKGTITRYTHSAESSIIANGNDDTNTEPYIFKPCTVQLLPPKGARTIENRQNARAMAAERGTLGTFTKQKRTRSWSAHRRLTGSTNVSLE